MSASTGRGPGPTPAQGVLPRLAALLAGLAALLAPAVPALAPPRIPGPRLRRRDEGAPAAPPHRSDPTVSAAASPAPRWRALGTLDRGWRRPDGRWDIDPHFRPRITVRHATRDYRRGYPEVWPLEHRMRAVGRPYLLRTTLPRLGRDFLTQPPRPARVRPAPAPPPAPAEPQEAAG